MEEVYEKLEEINVLKFFSDFSYDKKYKNFVVEKREEFVEKENDDNIRKCQVLIDTLNFTTNNDNISYLFAGTDGEGNPFEYPDIKNFIKDDFTYLIGRLDETNNLFLKSRYSHVLWHSSEKHIRYGEIAATSYLEISKCLFNETNDLESKSLGIHVVNSIKNAILISSKFRKGECFKDSKTFLLQVVSDFSSLENLYVNTSLMFFMIENKKLFKKDDFVGLENELYKIAQNEDDFRKIEILELGKKIDTKLGNKNLKWDKEIAESYESMSYKREDETNLVSTQFAQEAVKYFKKAKEKGKIKELTERYQVLKQSMKLGQFSTRLDVTKMMNFARTFSDKVSDKKSHEILFTLMYDPNILPSYDELEEQSLKQKKNHPIQFLATTSIIDNNGHVSQYFSTDEEQVYRAILQNFDFSLQYCRTHLLREIFFKSVLKGNLTASDFVEFMRTKSWLGQNITRIFTQGEQEEYNWIPLIAPAINEYIQQLHLYLTNQNNYINLILSIDSLAIKIEGILRDIVNMSGGTSFFFIPDKNTRSVAREKDINALFHEDIIKDLISKDDLLFLKFLLVEKAGLNLRNKVSHSLFRYAQNYSIDYMNLLIIAVLKLSKNEYYPLKEK